MALNRNTAKAKPAGARKKRWHFRGVTSDGAEHPDSLAGRAGHWARQSSGAEPEVGGEGQRQGRVPATEGQRQGPDAQHEARPALG